MCRPELHLFSKGKAHSCTVHAFMEVLLHSGIGNTVVHKAGRVLALKEIVLKQL